MLLKAKLFHEILYLSLVAVQHIINFHDAQHQEAIRERQVRVVCLKHRRIVDVKLKLSGLDYL